MAKQKMISRLQSVIFGTIALSVTFYSGAALAEYPERNIGMLIPFSAGGATDVPGRFFANELEKNLGVNIIVSNVTGAGGTIGATQLSKAKPDGYSLGFLSVGAATTSPHLRKTSYGIDAWEPICLVSQGPLYVTVLKDSPIKSMDELIEKSKTGTLVTGGSPAGTVPHIAQLAVASAYGTKFKYIPHEGINEAVKSMLGGRVDMTVWVGDAASRFGLRPLAILDSKRSEKFPDVPTLAELGHPVESSVWFGFFAPAGTPQNIVDTLAGACEKCVESKSFQDNMKKANRQVRYLPPKEFDTFFRQQYEQYGKVMKEAGIVK